MPELPEVEAARRLIERLCTGAKLIFVTAQEQGGGPREGSFDEIIFENGTEHSPTDSESRYRAALLQQTLKSVGRKGKQLWFEFVEPGSPCVLFHFGMTGTFAIKGQDALKYKSFKVDDAQWPPRFTKLLIEFDNGEALAFCDPRRLGRIKIRSDPHNTSPLKDLGIDPLNDTIPDVSTLQQKMKLVNAPIKSLLLDQERIFCGIGNYLADEILYQARIHPSTKANSLSEAGIGALITALKYVIHTTVNAEADYKLFPPDWLFHCRWDKVKSKSQKIQLPNGSAVVFEEVAGRTTAIVPSVQLLRGPLVQPALPSAARGKAKVVVESFVATEESSITDSGAKAKRKRKAIDVGVDAEIESKQGNNIRRGAKIEAATIL